MAAIGENPSPSKKNNQNKAPLSVAKERFGNLEKTHLQPHTMAGICRLSTTKCVTNCRISQPNMFSRCIGHVICRRGPKGISLTVGGWGASSRKFVLPSFLFSGAVRTVSFSIPIKFWLSRGLSLALYSKPCTCKPSCKQQPALNNNSNNDPQSVCHLSKS